MLELIEKAFLTGVGALSLTQKKAEELVEEMKKQFNLSEEKGKELVTRMQETARENQKKLEELAQQEVRRSCERLGLVPREEFEKLTRRVQKLEKQLKAAGEEPVAGT